MLKKIESSTFASINRAYSSVFKPNRLSVGLVVPIEAYTGPGADDGLSSGAGATCGKTRLLFRLASRCTVQGAFVRRCRSGVRPVRVSLTARRSHGADRAWRCQHHPVAAPSSTCRQGRSQCRRSVRRAAYPGGRIGRPAGGVSGAEHELRRSRRTLSRKL